MTVHPHKNQLLPSPKDSEEDLTTTQVAFAKVVGQALAELWHRQSRVRATNDGHSALQDSGSRPSKP